LEGRDRETKKPSFPYGGNKGKRGGGTTAVLRNVVGKKPPGIDRVTEGQSPASINNFKISESQVGNYAQWAYQMEKRRGGGKGVMICSQWGKEARLGGGGGETTLFDMRAQT